MRRKKFTYKGAPDIIMPMLDALGEIPWDDIVYNTAQILKPFLVGKKYKAKGYTELSLERLCEQGVIRKRKRQGRIVCELTARGKLKLERSNLQGALHKEQKWDGRWRLVIFDIPEVNRKQRNLLRRELQGQGFVKVQHSVWVYPYECYEYVGLLKTSFALGSTVLYAVVERLEDDEFLRRRFKLA